LYVSGLRVPFALVREVIREHAPREALLEMHEVKGFWEPNSFCAAGDDRHLVFEFFGHSFSRCCSVLLRGLHLIAVRDGLLRMSHPPPRARKVRTAARAASARVLSTSFRATRS